MSTPFEPQGAFLGLEPVDSDPSGSRYAVLPIPYEGTVSYRLGTADGPEAIIEASQQVELFDEELLGEFFQAGVTTCPAIGPADSPEAQDRLVYEAARELMAAGKFVLSLGGEHSVTYPLVRAAAEQHGEISVLQIDAHADLRESYDGTIYSHASVMRRVLEVTGRVAQVGIRNFSLGEFEQCPERVKQFITPAVIADDPNWIDRTLSLLGDKVYITVDIDGLDPAIAPGTGTPEPGGMTWRETTSLLRRVCREREVVSADITEVRPIPPNHVTEFLAARLAYKLIVYTQNR
jgi:agmatinase